MRSIRRSLLGYLLVLLALALGAVVLFVDRFAVDAIQARELAETRRSEEAYRTRQLEARTKFDAELMTETKALSRVMWSALVRVPGVNRGPGRSSETRPKDGERTGESRPRESDSPTRPPSKDVLEYRQRSAGLMIGLSTAPSTWPAVATAAALSRPYSPLWSGFEAPRAVTRLHLTESLRRVLDEDQRVFEDDDHARPHLPDFYQFQFIVYYPGQSGHTVGMVRSPQFDHDLPLTAPPSNRPNADPHYDDIELPNVGRLRRVVVEGPWMPFRLPSPLPFPSNGPFPPGPPGLPPGPSRRFAPADFSLRVYIHYARPYAELDSRLTADQQERDERLAQVHQETRKELNELRTKLGLIGGGSFLALVVGGWVIVAHGLAPIRKLSDAVSRVSERDFRLPAVDGPMSGELVPIVARITQTLDLLRRAFEREKQAVADISHELRTPIASLLATLDVSLRKPRTPEQYRATLEDCRAIARQLGQLVERIMTLASLDAGQTRIAAGRTDAAELAAGCAAIIRPLAEAHELTFHLTAPGPLELDTDRDQLREVLMNLLHNAVEYNRPGGRVELHASRDADRVVIEVRDTGIGMTPEIAEKVFERFYRADPSRHATGVHAGLGLAIVKEYVNRLGGIITVETRPNEGSTFRVSLPASSPLSEEPNEPAPLAGTIHPNARLHGEPAPARS